MHYSRVVIILFSIGLCNGFLWVYILYGSVLSIYSFGKTNVSCFCVLVFRVSVYLVFSFEVFCSMFEFNIISKDLTTFV